MKIISRFKDCYDHISYIYGVDEKIVYNRDTIPIQEIIARDIPGWRMLRDIVRHLKYGETASIVVIVDKMYFVVRNISGEERALESTDRLMNIQSILRDDTHNDPEMILALTKKVGIPVYRIDCVQIDWNDEDRKLIARINQKTPRLSDIKGMVALLDSQQIYQEIAYVISNLLKTNPDTTPPIVVSDKYKIQAAGFDLKQSFRHRR